MRLGEALLDLPYDLRERIAFLAIAARMHDVYRTAVYNATALQNVRFERRITAGRSLSFCARHPRIMMSSLVPSSATGLDSHGLAWWRFPRMVMLVPLGFGHKPSFLFEVGRAGALLHLPADDHVRPDDEMVVDDEMGVQIRGAAVTRYAQAKYERQLRPVVHYQAVEIQRIYRGALARRRASAA